MDRQRGSSLGDTITAEALAGDPYPLAAALRDREPVAWAPALDRWVVSRRDLALEVLGETVRFSTADDRSPIRAMFGPQMLSADGTEHRRHRDPLRPSFRRSALREGLGESIRSRAAAIVDGLGPGADLVPAASEMAVASVLDVLGLSDLVEVELVAAWYEDLAAALADVAGDGGVAARGRAAAEAFGAVIAQSPPGRAPVADHISNALLVAFGGIETTQSAILNALWALAVHERHQAAARRDSAGLAAAVEESLRWEPAVCTLTRYTTTTVRLGDVDIREGAIVECLVTGANRDPGVFHDPDVFDPDRTNAGDHLTFGYGHHHCLGAHLARMETSAFVGALLDRAPSGLGFVEPSPPPPRGHEFRRPPRLLLGW